MKLPEDQTIFLVSSNGILRFFLYAVAGLFESKQQEGKLVMKTGALSLLEYRQGAWQLSFWNKLISA
jgi:broad specificity phosphatase PhoE